MMNTTKRNSSLELLRIICIFLIICHHYSLHGGYDNFSYNNIHLNIVFIQILSMFGKASCSIFVLISGYFLIYSKNNMNYYKKIFKLIFEMLFYSLSILIIMSVTGIVPVSGTDVVKSLFPIFWGNWYVVFYILMYFIVPFINPGLIHIKKKKYAVFLVLLLIIWSVIPTLTVTAWETCSIDFFLVMYLIGAYIRLHIPKVNKKKALCVFLISTFIMMLSVILIDFIGKALKTNLIINYATYFMKYNSIISVIWAISAFCFFNTIEFKSNIINYIAISVIGIYLIHDNFLLREFIWQIVFPNKYYIDFPYIHAIVKIFTVFIVCLIVDIIRRLTVEKMINHYIDIYFCKITEMLKKYKIIKFLTD